MPLSTAFDVTLFRECGVLTSAGIQRQYLFSTKRRKSSAIDNRFNLITDEQEDDDAGNRKRLPGYFPKLQGAKRKFPLHFPKYSLRFPKAQWVLPKM